VDDRLHCFLGDLNHVAADTGGGASYKSAAYTYSDDRGLTWQPIAAPYMPLTGAPYQWIHPFGKTIEVDISGTATWLRPTYCLTTAAHALGANFRVSVLMKSVNRGATWTVQGEGFRHGQGTPAATGPTEWTITHLGSGSMYAVYRAVHTGDDRLYFNTSSDYGATWTAPVELFSGQAGLMAPELEVVDSGLVLTYGQRTSSPQGQIIRRSADGGATWGAAQLLVPRNSASGLNFGHAQILLKAGTSDTLLIPIYTGILCRIIYMERDASLLPAA
jgi:hypothetical protein